jgi:hypothetical protein
MKPNLILALVVVTTLLASGTALAKDIVCKGGLCVGTNRADSMVVSSGAAADQIVGRRGNDNINPGTGDDEVRGGGGADTIRDNTNDGDVDTFFGGKGNDFIDVREFRPDDEPDFVDCGPGTDTVFADPNDHLTNCEIVNLS